MQCVRSTVYLLLFRPVHSVTVVRNSSSFEMASLLNTFTRRAKPTTISLFGIFTSPFTLTRPNSTLTQARCSRFLLRQASDFAPRECPTPLVLLRAKGLPGAEEEKEE